MRRLTRLAMRPVVRLILSSAWLGAVLAPAAPAQSAVTIERLLSAPFPTGLIASPRGDAVAWVLNEKGARNIWVATPPTWAGRRVTTYSADDGQDITSLSWLPDASALLYVRGGPRNRAGEVPNPAQDPQGAESAIWRVSLAGGPPAKLGVAGALAISPSGDRAVVARGKLWLLSLQGETPQQQPLVNIRGDLSSVTWSPNGARIAFVSNRGDHSFIGVYDFASKAVKFIAPSTDSDSDPVWSPDGERIAFVRTPYESWQPFFQAKRTAAPWSILVANVTTGSAKIVFTADTGDGSVRQGISAADQVMWGAGNRLVFPWERSGWLHLYSVDADGGRPVLLTPGAGEVEHAILTRDGREVIYSSNQGDIDRRHLWRVSVNGGTSPVPLTKGDGIEWLPAELSDGAVAFLRSDARTPAHAAILERSKPLPRVLANVIPADFPSSALVQPQAVTVTATDGKQIPAQLFVPQGIRPGERRPAAIFFHGGSRRQMLLGFHYMDYYHNSYAMNQYLASRGYVVLSVNYRSGTGYGLAFREAEHYGASGASEFNDVVGAALYLRGRADVDPARIASWGGSYGGYLTAMALARAPELFATGVDIHGVHDWNVGIRTFVPAYDTLRMPDFARLAKASSPMAYLDRWKAPVLFIHGDDDRNVSFIESVSLIEQLRARQVEIETLVLPDEVHGFLRHASWMSVYGTMSEFLERRLRK